MNKLAVFGLDVEDWYHLDYVNNFSIENANFSMHKRAWNSLSSKVFGQSCIMRGSGG